ncbi:MAG TPA: HAD-IIB family hydrolase [Polyangiaceae bacterium]|nr:HAD-IIB family hydrolase [Polyangiaceae bacterium]
MVSLICIDVDGTLVGTGGRIAERIWPAAARAIQAGIRVALCTGRPAFGVTRSYAERLDPDGWHAFQNGASLVRLSTNESRSALLGPETVSELKRRSKRTGRILELYSDHGYAVESTSERAARNAELLGIPFVPRSLDAVGWPVVRAQWIIPADELDALMSEPHPGVELGPSTSPDVPGTCFVNLTPPGIDKASGIRQLCEIYGCSLSEVMFVGDGQNDLSAMRIVGTPVAMGNADPGLRALAKYQVDHVDSGGLADALALALELTRDRCASLSLDRSRHGTQRFSDGLQQ